MGQSAADCGASISLATLFPSRPGTEQTSDEGDSRHCSDRATFGGDRSRLSRGGRSTLEANFIRKPQLNVAADTLNETHITGILPPSSEQRGSPSLCGTP
jgi:hypothetical protein